ncbi:hypothetical protein PHMEG_00017294 [Phytophthora megakarya]|uniref:Uncharacterized protein n=1 Tax=Phytophthora megakarya TaxID=4795 RepID=A0A225VX45_9STRA|nr:hypothetical protein PHMEG_00017294 [Phytophthora megakarya]
MDIADLLNIDGDANTDEGEAGPDALDEGGTGVVSYRVAASTPTECCTSNAYVGNLIRGSGQYIIARGAWCVFWILFMCVSGHTTTMNT